MFAKVSGLVPGELVHVIADAHFYDRHIPVMEEVIARPQHAAPKLVIKRDVTDFYDFKVEDFELENYEYNPEKVKLEVAV